MKLCKFTKIGEVRASGAYWCRFRQSGHCAGIGNGETCHCQKNVKNVLNHIVNYQIGTLKKKKKELNFIRVDIMLFKKNKKGAYKGWTVSPWIKRDKHITFKCPFCGCKLPGECKCKWFLIKNGNKYRWVSPFELKENFKFLSDDDFEKKYENQKRRVQYTFSNAK